MARCERDRPRSEQMLAAASEAGWQAKAPLTGKPGFKIVAPREFAPSPAIPIPRISLHQALKKSDYFSRNGVVTFPPCLTNRVTPNFARADKSSKAPITRARKPLILNWSHPPGLNRRPADYETQNLPLSCSVLVVLGRYWSRARVLFGGFWMAFGWATGGRRAQTPRPIREEVHGSNALAPDRGRLPFATCAYWVRLAASHAGGRRSPYPRPAHSTEFRSSVNLWVSLRFERA
jgi:hypothetical protein